MHQFTEDKEPLYSIYTIISNQNKIYVFLLYRYRVQTLERLLCPLLQWEKENPDQTSG